MGRWAVRSTSNQVSNDVVGPGSVCGATAAAENRRRDPHRGHRDGKGQGNHRNPATDRIKTHQ